MPKLFFKLLLVALLGGSFSPALAGAEVLKIATAAPEGSKWMRAMRSGADEIRQRSEGRVEIKFFAGGVMGNDNSVLRKIRVGQLQGGAFTAGSLESVYRDIGLFSLPLLFRSYDEVDFVRKRLDADLRAGLEEAGFACFGFAEGGFAHLMAPVSIRTIDDVRGRKVWVPEGDLISFRAMKALEMAPVTLPITDVMTGLQANLIEMIATSPIGALAFQWHTRIKYVNNTPLSYLYATMMIDKKSFGRLVAADQELVREVMGRIYRDLDGANRIDNREAAAALAGQGIRFVDSESQDIAAWRKVAGGLNDTLRSEGVFSPALYDRLQAALKEYRSGHAAGTP